MSLRQFYRYVERLQGQDKPHWKQFELMFAQLTAMVANTGFLRFKEWRTPMEFMPSYYQPKPASEESAKAEAAKKVRDWMESMIK